jgi:hypothetical protein
MKVFEEHDYDLINPTLEQIKNLPLENDYPISDYIELFKLINENKYDDEDEIEDIYEYYLSGKLNENQKEIMRKIIDMWVDMVDAAGSSYYGLYKMFQNYSPEILEHYKKI